ncbi:T9SS type A sorting domain-containing protein [Candidatus Acetothermia bacterium]|nr:T9SS type A sorting domain-containing protein [Candidatus Acetothermia bacterium]MBI3644072.1 T9SS type A sorting domain-containing protein [Candidatus Acetothermia bacterium]
MSRIIARALAWASLIAGLFATTGLAADQTTIKALIPYDINRNNQLDSPEFFHVVDDWVSGKLTNTIMFAAIDLWLDNLPLSTNPAHQPQPQEPSCPNSEPLLALRNGVPFGSLAHPAPSSGLSSPIQIAFSDPVFLPQGTNVALTISSDMPGIEPRNGSFSPPVEFGTFYALGPLQLNGTGTIRYGTLLPPQFGWAAFTPFWDDLTPFGTISFSVRLTTPHCSAVQASGSVNLSRLSPSLMSGFAPMKSTTDMITFSSLNNAPIQVEIFDLSGRSLYLSNFSKKVELSALTLRRKISTGIYLYLMRARSLSGEALPVRIGKIVLRSNK